MTSQNCFRVQETHGSSYVETYRGKGSSQLGVSDIILGSAL
jgi:hypothetical protein